MKPCSWFSKMSRILIAVLKKHQSIINLRKFCDEAAHLPPNHSKKGLIAHLHHAVSALNNHVSDPQVFRFDPRVQHLNLNFELILNRGLTNSVVV
jgi:hypothetical protein